MKKYCIPFYGTDISDEHCVSCVKHCH